MQQRQKSHLMAFLEKFEGAQCVLDETDMPYDDSVSKPLLLLAKAFETSGEYHKTISIYLYLLKHAKNPELLEQLGKIYLRGGFLERAESIFLEILAKQPRDKPVLYQLGVVYEMLQEYEKAIETLEPLEILGEDTAVLRAFWEFEKLQKNSSLSPAEKEVALLDMSKRHPSLYRYTIAALFELSHEKAWGHLEPDRLGESLDLLWYLPKSQLDFDIIQSDSRLAKIYFAKGILDEVTAEQMSISSGIIGIDILAAAKSAGETRGDISFSYLCTQCKHSFPISFKRCPNCLAINSVKLEEQITKHEKRDYSIF